MSYTTPVSRTRFCLQIHLRPSVPKDVLALIEFMRKNKNREEFPLDIPIPTHLFFMTVPKWSQLFLDAKVQWERAKNKCWILSAEGMTDLEEQDIGLFLRWLCPYASSAKKLRPMRLAVVRCTARQDYSSVSYFLRDQQITMDFTTKPSLSVNQFRMAATQ